MLSYPRLAREIGGRWITGSATPPIWTAGASGRAKKWWTIPSQIGVWAPGEAYDVPLDLKRKGSGRLARRQPHLLSSPNWVHPLRQGRGGAGPLRRDHVVRCSVRLVRGLTPDLG